MKIGHHYVEFYGVRDEAAVRKEARALALAPMPDDSEDRRLLELARQVKPQHSSYRLGLEPSLTVKDLVAVGIWFGDFGTRGSDRFKSALSYGLGLLTFETGELDRRVAKRKALSVDDHQRINNLVARAIAEWKPWAVSVGREKSLWVKIDLKVFDAADGRSIFKDDWQDGNEPFANLSEHQWRALEHVLIQHDQGFHTSDHSIIAAAYPATETQPGDGESWGHVLARQSDEQLRLVGTLRRRGLLRHYLGDLIGLVDEMEDAVRAEVDEWVARRATRLAALGLSPRLRQSALVTQI